MGRFFKFGVHPYRAAIGVSCLIAFLFGTREVYWPHSAVVELSSVLVKPKGYRCEAIFSPDGMAQALSESNRVAFKLLNDSLRMEFLRRYYGVQAPAPHHDRAYQVAKPMSFGTFLNIVRWISRRSVLPCQFITETDPGSQRPSGFRKATLEEVREYQAIERVLEKVFQETSRDPRSSEESLNAIAADLWMLRQYIDFLEGLESEFPLAVFAELPFDIELPDYQRSSQDSRRIVRTGHDKTGNISLHTINIELLDPRHRFSLHQALWNFLVAKGMQGNPRGHSFAQTISLIDGGETAPSFHFMDFSRMPTERDQLRHLQPRYMNAFEDMLRFIAARYSRRMEIPQETLHRLLSISRSLRQRSLSILTTRDSIIEASRQNAGHDSSHFKIEGALTIVSSKDATEPLPLELFTGISIPRLTQDEHLVEIGRFSIDQNESKIGGDEMLFAAAVAIENDLDLGRIIIEAGRVQARRFARYGFKAIRERKGFDGKPEFIMAANPAEFLTRTKELSRQQDGAR